ncbi:hypothetical protein THIX_10447 [Thiomonas sp. X19]|nr:hypothetical protein THIX_10447 [Thiomonas sp. X19]
MPGFNQRLQQRTVKARNGERYHIAQHHRLTFMRRHHEKASDRSHSVGRSPAGHFCDSQRRG